jgi:HSP20 family protein
MRDLINFNRNDLFPTFQTLPTLFDRFFDHTNDFFKEFGLTYRDLRDNFSEETDKYILEVEIPGMKKESINLEFVNNGIHIVAEKKSMDKTTQSNSKVTRHYQLPGNVNKDLASASYVDGVLRIELPKLETPKNKKIEIK